jgi:hypothetical protein
MRLQLATSLLVVTARADEVEQKVTAIVASLTRNEKLGLLNVTRSVPCVCLTAWGKARDSP